MRSLVVDAHVSGFIGGKNEALSLTDAALHDLFAIYGEFRDTPYAHTTDILLEIERDGRLTLKRDGWTFQLRNVQAPPDCTLKLVCRRGGAAPNRRFRLLLIDSPSTSSPSRSVWR